MKGVDSWQQCFLKLKVYAFCPLLALCIFYTLKNTKLNTDLIAFRCFFSPASCIFLTL